MSIQEDDENDNHNENEEVQNSEERSSYKFIITAQYLKHNESTDEVKDMEQIVKLNKKKWSLSDLSHVHNEDNDLIFVPYITKKGALALLVNKELSETHYYRRKVISKIKVTEERLKLEGNLTTRFFDIEYGEVQLVERGGDQSINFPISIEQNKDQKENAFARRHHFKWELSIGKIKTYLENLTKKEELS